MSATKLQVSGTLVPRQDEAGFTLIELLVVLLLMGIVTTVEGPIDLATAHPTPALLTRWFASRRPARIVPNDLHSILRAPVFRGRSGTFGASVPTTAEPVPSNPSGSRVRVGPCTSVGESRRHSMALAAAGLRSDSQPLVGRGQGIRLRSITRGCDPSMAA